MTKQEHFMVVRDVFLYYHSNYDYLADDPRIKTVDDLLLASDWSMDERIDILGLDNLIRNIELKN